MATQKAVIQRDSEGTSLQIGGHDVAGATQRAVLMIDKDQAVLQLTVLVDDVDVDVAAADVQVPPKVRDLLLSLGWRAPRGE